MSGHSRGYGFIRFCLWGSCLLTLSLLTGCFLGPTVLKGNRLGYNQHLHASNNEELLINIVRMRYCEQPLFLQVGAITASFGSATSLGVSGSHNSRISAVYPRTSVTPSLGYSYSENPTIVYAPIQGAEYASRMLSEVDLSTYLLMVRGGWSLRTLSRLLVMRIGQLHNPVPNGPESYGPENNDAMFMELLNFFWILETRGDLEFVRIEKGCNNVGQAVVRIRFDNKNEAKRLGELVGSSIPLETLPSGALITTLKFNPVNNFSDREKGEIYFKLRNMLEVFWAVSFGVESGEEVEALKGSNKVRTPSNGVPHLIITVKTSDTEPTNAYVCVFTRGKWYYIADNDLYSKFCLSALGSLYSLQAKPPQGVHPVLTLPVSK